MIKSPVNFYEKWILVEQITQLGISSNTELNSFVNEKSDLSQKLKAAEETVQLAQQEKLKLAGDLKTAEETVQLAQQEKLKLAGDLKTVEKTAQLSQLAQQESHDKNNQLF